MNVCCVQGLHGCHVGEKNVHYATGKNDNVVAGKNQNYLLVQLRSVEEEKHTKMSPNSTFSDKIMQRLR